MQVFAKAALLCGMLACAGIAAAQEGDFSRGRNTYDQICGVCHGAKGEGGAGLPLKNIAERMPFAETIEKIKNPKEPMPKLFPAVLNEQAVQDVAAFVRTLR
jgi:mono/diheme cytochrome c family protein